MKSVLTFGSIKLKYRNIFGVDKVTVMPLKFLIETFKRNCEMIDSFHI